MSFPAYLSYKESGVEWLGKVPSHWRVDRISRLFATVGSGTTPPGPDFYEGGEFNWVTTGELREKAITSTLKKVNDSALSSLSALQVYPPGTILIAMYGATIGRLGWLEQPACTNQACCAMAKAVSVSPRFAFYCLSVATTALVLLSSGGGQPNINQEKIRAFRLPVPSTDEQIAIAAFLDRETAKIDALIEEQRRLIALLKEKRQAVISHAVTKGLDPHAPMKDSGIEWLGKVPAHWVVKRLRFLCHIGTGDADTANAVEDGEYPFFVRSPVIERIGDFSHDCEAVLTAGDGAGVGKVYHHFEGKFRAHQRVYIFSRFRGVAGRFFYAYMSEMFAKAVLEGTAKSTVESLRRPMIADFWMTVPPVAEQTRIISHIESASAQFDVLSDEAETAIKLLSERRAALISAAVTGKIDVRGSATVLPFPVDRARARSLVATEIIERSASQATFGRVKFQKIAFLAEGHVGISELAGCYIRDAAGPLDRNLRDDMEGGAHNLAGIVIDQVGGTGTMVSYRLTQPRGAHRQEIADWLGPDRVAKLDKLITDLADLDKKGVEAVATLYGVWNDALSEGNSPTDDMIIASFLNDWHPEKREKFRASELPEWLGWMRRHGIVPTGSGPKTTTGRLFV